MTDKPDDIAAEILADPYWFRFKARTSIEERVRTLARAHQQQAEKLEEAYRQLVCYREGHKENWWVWQGGSEDHLESLTCPVLIHPEALRDMVQERDALREAFSNRSRRLERQIAGAVKSAMDAHPPHETSCGALAAAIAKRIIGVLKADACTTLQGGGS